MFEKLVINLLVQCEVFRKIYYDEISKDEKQHDAVDKSTSGQHCAKTGPIHLVLVGLMAGQQTGRQDRSGSLF